MSTHAPEPVDVEEDVGASDPDEEEGLPPSVRFIERYLLQGKAGRLTGLLVGQLDAFNRMSATFGQTFSAHFQTAVGPTPLVCRLLEGERREQPSEQAVSVLSTRLILILAPSSGSAAYSAYKRAGDAAGQRRERRAADAPGYPRAA